MLHKRGSIGDIKQRRQQGHKAVWGNQASLFGRGKRPESINMHATGEAFRRVDTQHAASACTKSRATRDKGGNDQIVKQPSPSGICSSML